MDKEKYRKQFEYWCKKFGIEFNQEMFDVYCYDQQYKKEHNMASNSKNCIEILIDMLNGIDYNLPLLDRYKKFKSYKAMTYSLERCKLRYGNMLGEQKFNEYKNKQAYSNSYEYKKKKYGWTEEDYNNFNKSRAITLPNMIKKYGKKVGKEKYDNYCKKQSYVGCKREYFIEKYGEEEGILKYNEMIEKKLKPIIGMLGNSTSKLELLIISSLISNSCQFLCRPTVMYDEYIGEYISDISYQFELIDKETDKHYFYDACLLDKRVLLEINGDLWHNNKRNEHIQKLMEDESSILVKNIRKRDGIDEIKMDLANKSGFLIYTIWEMDWYKHSEEIIEHFHQWVESEPTKNYSTEELYKNESC